MQEESSSLQKPSNIMQILMCDQADATFPKKMSRVNAMAVYDTGSNMSCMSYTCYMRLKDPPSLKMVPAMSVYSATGHD